MAEILIIRVLRIYLISICLRKRDPSACMIIHILFIQTSQLHSRSVLICLLSITLTTKSASHTSQFIMPCGSHILNCSRIRKNVTHREQRTHGQRDRQTENSITDATLIPWITGLSGPIYNKIEY